MSRISSKINGKHALLIVLLFLTLNIFTPALAQTVERLSPVKLSNELSLTGRVISFQISPNGETVVFVSRFSTGAPDVLYSTPITGGIPTPLTPISGDVFSDFQITPDGSRVVFRGDLTTRNLNELYSVPINGGTVQKLNGDLISGGDVDSFQISLDSNRVVYFADQETDNLFEIFSVPSAGGSSVKLNPDPTRPGIQALVYQISPASDRVVFIHDPDTVNTLELFSVPIEGGVISQLDNEILNSFGTDISQVDDFTIAPDGQTVVYRGLRERDITINRRELLSVPITGGTITLLSGELFAASDYRFSDDSQSVIFSALQPVNFGGTLVFLYSVGVGGGVISNVAVFDPNDFIGVKRFALDNTLDQVVYQLDTAAEPLYSVPFAGGTPVQLNTPPDDRVGAYKVSPSGGLVGYTSNTELKVVPSSGGSSVVANTEPQPQSSVIRFDFDPLGEKLSYVTQSELFVTRVSDEVIYLANGELTSGGAVFNTVFNSTGAHIVYTADQDTDSVIELYAVAIPEPPIVSDESDELCVPIKTSGNRLAVICL